MDPVGRRVRVFLGLGIHRLRLLRGDCLSAGVRRRCPGLGMDRRSVGQVWLPVTLGLWALAGVFFMGSGVPNICRELSRGVGENGILS